MSQIEIRLQIKILVGAKITNFITKMITQITAWLYKRSIISYICEKYLDSAAIEISIGYKFHHAKFRYNF